MSNFNSQSNKALLWGILNDQNIFQNIPNSEINNIQNLFESEILKIQNKANNKTSDLLILNKLLIQNFTSTLSFYKENKNFKENSIKSEFEEKTNQQTKHFG